MKGNPLYSTDNAINTLVFPAFRNAHKEYMSNFFFATHFIIEDNRQDKRNIYFLATTLPQTDRFLCNTFKHTTKARQSKMLKTDFVLPFMALLKEMKSLLRA